MPFARRVIGGPDRADREGHGHDGVDRDHHDRRHGEDVAEMAQRHEPASADDDRWHHQHETSACAGHEFKDRTTLPERQRSPRHGERQRERRRKKRRQEGEQDRGHGRSPHRVLRRQPREVRLKSGGHGGQHRSGDEQQRDQDQHGIQHRSRRRVRHIAAWRHRQVGVARHIRAEPGQQGDDDSGQRDLQESQRHGPCRIEVEAKRLVDRDLKRRGGRTAAQRQHDGEGGDAQHEHEPGDTRQRLPERRPFDEPERRAAAHAELARQPPLVGGNRVQGFKEQAHGQWKVEEDVRDEDSGQAIDARPGAPVQPFDKAGEIARASVERQHAQRGHDRRQGQRDGEQLQDQRPAGKARMPRQRPGDEQGRHHRQQRR